MKFKIGQVVKHRLKKGKYIIISYHPKRWFRKTPYYRVSNGIIRGDDDEPYPIHFFEVELKVVKSGKGESR